MPPPDPPPKSTQQGRAPSPPASASPRNLAGIWDEVDEVDVELNEIEGHVPEGLVGTLFRNGPGSRRLATTFFDGDGMIRALRFGPGGKLRYRSRFVRTPKFLAEQHSDVPVYRTAGTMRPGGVLANVGRAPANEANTHVIWFQGQLLALFEGGHPYRIDPRTLDTLGTVDFGGSLSAMTTFSAHPTICPDTGELFNFSPNFVGKPRIDGYRVDARGRVHKQGHIPLREIPMLHDAGMSQRYQVFATPPMGGKMLPMLLGMKSVFECLEERPDLGTTIGLLPRDRSKPIVIETDGFSVAHVVQCFDDGEDVVLDVAISPDWSDLKPDLDQFRNGSWSSAGKQWTARYRIHTRTRRIEDHVINNLPMDFPRTDLRLATKRRRYCYGTVNPEPGMGGLYRALARIDLESGEAEVWDPGPDYLAHEPVFVPDPARQQAGIDECGGWLVTYMHNAARRLTEIVVHDAAHVADGPLCTVHTQLNAGMTYHGDWVPELF